jgi:hypothetical protein
MDYITLTSLEEEMSTLDAPNMSLRYSFRHINHG